MAKLTQFLALGISAITTVLGLIPLALQKLNAPADELKHYDKMAASKTVAATATMQETYGEILAEHTDNMDVNTSLDALPRTL